MSAHLAKYKQSHGTLDNKGKQTANNIAIITNILVINFMEIKKLKKSEKSSLTFILLTFIGKYSYDDDPVYSKEIIVAKKILKIL